MESLSLGCLHTELHVHFLEKATQKPPKTFDLSNLKAYTKQFRIVTTDPTCNFEFTTSLFDDQYDVDLSPIIL